MFYDEIWIRSGQDKIIEMRARSLLYEPKDTFAVVDLPTYYSTKPHLLNLYYSDETNTKVLEIILILEVSPLSTITKECIIGKVRDQLPSFLT